MILNLLVTYDTAIIVRADGNIVSMILSSIALLFIIDVDNSIAEVLKIQVKVMWIVYDDEAKRKVFDDAAEQLVNETRVVLTAITATSLFGLIVLGFLPNL